MAKAKSSSTQTKLDRLEKKKLIMQSKVDVLTKGIVELDQQIIKLRSQLSE